MMPQQSSLQETPSQTAGPYLHIGLLPRQVGFEVFQPAGSNVLVSAQPKGERIRIEGRVFDGSGSACRDVLVEIWQANAAGRYHHERDAHDAPLDPSFRGAGRVFTDGDGRYRFTSIKPGAYPWRNHPNAWRPNHIHFSLFGASWGARMVTQMYFPGDPLFPLDPIYQSIVDPQARQRLVASYDHDVTQHEWSTGYRWDIVLTGSHRTPMEEDQ